MKKMVSLFVATLIICFTVSVAFAGWDSCKGCHTDSGKPGPSKASMLKKFKSSEDLIKAAMASTSPMMQSMKNETVLKAAAKEMGYKDSKAGKKDEKKDVKDASKEAKKEDVKKKIKAEDKTKEVDKSKTEKKETVKEPAPKAEIDKKEDTKKKKKPIEGC